MLATRHPLTLFLALTLLLLAPLCSAAAKKSGPAEVIAALINPQKLATLGKRGANPRVQKAVYWLATAHHSGQNITNVAAAVSEAGYANAQAAALTRDALLRNLDIATKLGCLDKSGLDHMRKGQSPTVQKGPYKGDQLSVDHIIPYAVCPELDHVIANLELMPLRLNESKNDKVGARQLQKAAEFDRAGLLTTAGLKQVRSAAR
jgi:hypothetical protein